MSEIQNITLSANREISKAIADERIFYAVVMRVVPSKDGQPQHIPVSVPLAVQGTQSIPGMIPLEEMDAFRASLLAAVEEEIPDLCSRIDLTGQLTEDDRAEIAGAAREALERYAGKRGG